jgi:hypothetical protein
MTRSRTTNLTDSILKQPNNVIASAGEAIHWPPRMQQAKCGLLRRIRLRPKAGFGGQELLAMTAGHDFAISPHGFFA